MLYNKRWMWNIKYFSIQVHEHLQEAQINVSSKFGISVSNCILEKVKSGKIIITYLSKSLILLFYKGVHIFTHQLIWFGLWQYHSVSAKYFQQNTTQHTSVQTNGSLNVAINKRFCSFAVFVLHRSWRVLIWCSLEWNYPFLIRLFESNCVGNGCIVIYSIDKAFRLFTDT